MDKNRLPVDETSEKTILGILILKPKDNLDIIDSLSEDDFYFNNSQNKHIFIAIKTLAINNLPIDLVSVCNFMNEKKTLNLVGGVEYVASLTDLVTTFNNVDYYLSTIKKTTLLRNFFIKMDESEEEYLSKPMEDTYKFVQRYQNQLNEIASKRETSNFISLTDAANKVDDRLKTLIGNEKTITGYTTGFSFLDKKINGLNKGNMIILAGRPGMGKSTLALNIGFKMAQYTQKPVAYFSLEMDADSLAIKLFACVGGVDSKHIQSGYLTTKERAQLTEAKDKLVNIPLFIDDKRTNNIADIFIKSKKLKETYKDLGLVIIDHIGITDKEKDRKFSSDTEELSYKAREVKKMAGELNCPVLCLTQLNRQVEIRDDKTPQMSDLRGSGELEQSADQIILLYREKYYDKKQTSNNDENKENNPDLTLAEGYQIVELNIAKNRAGEVGRTYLLFNPAFSRFDTPKKETVEAIEKCKRGQ